MALPGVVTTDLAVAARTLALRRGLFISADAQGDLERFEGYDLLRIGRQDAARSLGRPLPDDAAVEASLRDLLERLQAGAVVLGRGGEGSSAMEAGGACLHLPPTNVSEVFDVTGAGDTAIAVLTLALVAGASLREAAELANAAAGCVVRRLGVAAPSAAEILAELGTVNR
jgi:bifunctional ADP-heptose synthase (sugar kinase/adenylyltransferase)